MVSFQCLALESSFPYNLIENVVTTFCASLLAYKQTFLDPSVKHWDDEKGALGSILHVTPIVFWHKTRRILDLFASKAC